METTLHINGQSVLLTDVEPDMPLLWVLRDMLGLTGTKYSCGMAICGTCLVQVDGEAVPSCRLKISDLSDKSIITIEGLSDERLHAVQQAWVEEDVSQCGYCQPGQIINAAALLRSNPNPTEDEIDQAMNRCLCRCGTYPRIRKAIMRAAVLLKEGGKSA